MGMNGHVLLNGWLSPPFHVYMYIYMLATPARTYQINRFPFEINGFPFEINGFSGFPFKVTVDSFPPFQSKGFPLGITWISTGITCIWKGNPLNWKGNPLNNVKKSISLGKEIHEQ